MNMKKTYRVSLAGRTPLNFEAHVKAESEEEAFKIVLDAIDNGDEDSIGHWDDESISDLWEPEFDFGQDDKRSKKDYYNPDTYNGSFVEEEEGDDDEENDNES